jgi:hypothetical protein
MKGAVMKILLFLALVGSIANADVSSPKETVSEETPTVRQVDDKLIAFFAMKDLRGSETTVREILEQRQQACKRDQASCFEIGTLSKALCSPVGGRIHWTPLTWKTIFNEIPSESVARTVHGQVKNCASETSTGKLIAELALVNLALEKDWEPFLYDLLTYVETTWKKPPADNRASALLAVTGSMDKMIGPVFMRTEPMRRLSLLSMSWFTPKEISKLGPAELKKWSVNLAFALPSLGYGPELNKALSEISLEQMTQESTLWAIRITGVRCRVLKESHANMAPCIRDLENIRDHSVYLPKQKLSVEVLLFEYKGNSDDLVTVERLIGDAKVWNKPMVDELEEIRTNIKQRPATRAEVVTFTRKDLLETLSGVEAHRKTLMEKVRGPNVELVTTNLNRMAIFAELREKEKMEEAATQLKADISHLPSMKYANHIVDAIILAFNGDRESEKKLRKAGKDVPPGSYFDSVVKRLLDDKKPQ